MSVFFRRRGEPPATTVDVTLSGTFDSSLDYVTMDGTKYTSEQTVTVAKGTIVTVYCGSKSPLSQKNAKITLNGTTVANGTTSAGAEYTFTATDNCAIVLTSVSYYYADITMPA